MLNLKKIALTVFIIVVAIWWVAFSVHINIVTPRLGIPKIIQAGKEFDISLKSSVPFYFPKINWVLEGNGQRHDLRVVASKINAAHKVMTLKVPDEIGVGGYSLLVNSNIHDDLRHPRQKNAIHIIDQVPEAFTMVQLADLPTLGGDESGDELLAKIISEINIINPSVVLFTGDIAYGGGWDQYDRLVQAMATLDAPVIAVAGNHEYEGWAGYLHYFVEPYHSVDYGRYKFISLNSGHSRDQMTASQYRWLLEQLDGLKGKTPIVQIHHPVFHNEGQRGYVHVRAADLAGLFKNHGVPIVLSGHWHGDMVFDEQGNERRDTWDFPGTPYVVTTAAGADLRPPYSASPLHHGYRLIRLQNDKLVFYTYDYDGDGKRDAAASIPVGKLNVVSRANNTITIRNDLNENFPNARVKIKTRDTDVKLVPSEGRVLRETKQGDETVFEVLVDLPANSETTIALAERT